MSIINKFITFIVGFFDSRNITLGYCLTSRKISNSNRCSRGNIMSALDVEMQLVMTELNVKTNETMLKLKKQLALDRIKT